MVGGSHDNFLHFKTNHYTIEREKNCTHFCMILLCFVLVWMNLLQQVFELPVIVLPAAALIQFSHLSYQE